MFIETSSKSLLEKIDALPEVTTIRLQVVAQLSIEPEVALASNFTAVNEWGVNIIQAPAVWATGNNGKGVVVSSIDTGVRSTHEALKNNFRTDHGWFDPYDKTATPADTHGHGTHTMGSMVGTTGIGVAPGAQWIACKGCDGKKGCTEEALLSCAQFILCPTDATGQDAQCAKAPHVVNNSWGGSSPGESWYQAAVDAWRKAGIIPVFANGNDGSDCSTVRSPGDYVNVIGVGATGSDDKLAYFSSRGPAPNNLLKPDVSAPGYNVRSAKNTGDTEYQTMSGTSMAAPHVTGAVALIVSANPGISYDAVYQLFIKNIDTDSLTSDNANCGGVSDKQYPNNNYGYGRINVKKVLNSNPTTKPVPTTTPTPTPTTTLTPTTTSTPTTKPTPTPTPTSTPTPKPTPTSTLKPTTKSPKTKTPKPTTPTPTTKTPPSACSCTYGDACSDDGVCRGGCLTDYFGFGDCSREEFGEAECKDWGYTWCN